MKPRTKTEKEVVELSKKLPGLTARQRDWAEKTATAKNGFYSAGRVWCTECGCSTPFGKELQAGLVGNKPMRGYECPVCGAKLLVIKSKKKKNVHKEYVTYATTRKGYQVLRHFMLVQHSRLHEDTSFFLEEAVQEWITEKGTSCYLALRRNTNSYYCDAWNYSSGLDLRGGDTFVYQIHANHIYPETRFIPMLHKFGLKYSFHGANPSKLMRSLLQKKGESEWLLKSGQYEVLDYSLSNHYQWRNYRDSVKICIRNHYRIKDVHVWLDYLELLSYFGKDLHNARYVCPEDLHKAHDELMERKRKHEEKINKEKAMLQAVRYEKEYLEAKGRFLDISFSGNGIYVNVLPSVKAFVEEGTAMHHCVFTCGYYQKANSLILSARDRQGNRLETVEVDLSTFEIAQCFGKFNRVTEMHEDIKRLVMKNMNLIRKAV